VTVDGCSATSAIFEPLINRNPEITIDAIAPILCSDGLQDVLINSNPSGGTAPYIYSWSGPNGFSSNEEDPFLINVTAANAGNYVVILSDANGCTSPLVSVTLDVSEGPNQPVITSTGATCEGDNTTLSVNSYTGASISYDWKKDNISLGVNSNILVIDPITTADAGDYTLTATVDGCESISEAFEVEVYANPTVTIDAIAPITCTSGNDDLPINATVNGGLAPYTFSWTGPNNFLSALEDPTLININEAFSGTYNLIVTDANGCQSATATLELSVSEGIAEPSLISTGVVCEGGSVIISLNTQYTGSNVSYAWTKDGIALSNTSATLELNPVTLADIGMYEVTVNVDGCSSTSDAIDIECRRSTGWYLYVISSRCE